MSTAQSLGSCMGLASGHFHKGIQALLSRVAPTDDTAGDDRVPWQGKDPDPTSQAGLRVCLRTAVVSKAPPLGPP